MTNIDEIKTSTEIFIWNGVNRSISISIEIEIDLNNQFDYQDYSTFKHIHIPTYNGVIFALRFSSRYVTARV